MFHSALGDAPRRLLAEPLNVLIAGMPGKGNPAPELTDTMIMAHLDPVENRAILFSLPRDLLVRAPEGIYYTKLNGLYERSGITSLRLKAEDITGLAITRYAIVDLAAVREIVDAVGGVNVYVEKDIYDPRFPSANFGVETFSLKAGWRYLDGLTATRYIRTRNDAEGDFGRMRRQQVFLEALKQKISGLSLLWDFTTFLKILESVTAHVQTNISADEAAELFAWGKNIPADRIILAPLDADPEKKLFMTGTFLFGAERADVVKPLAGIERYDAVREYAQQVLSNETTE